MKRLDALQVIDDVYAEDPLVMTCGAASRELASLGRRDSHLYLLDSMGLAGPVGLGLALAGVGPVAAVEGDGSLLMGLSMVASIAYHRPEGLALVVLDNREHASAARIPTQATAVDVAALCRGAGLDTAEVSEPDDLRAVLTDLRTDGRLGAVVARIEGGNATGVPFLLEDPAALAIRFTAFLEERHDSALRA
jgi:thiamine pyrophosphate-dependent acetolactate synthase large subunit-like protein